MKAEDFFKKQEAGEYNTPIPPKEPNWKEEEYLIKQSIPEVINENRSIKWNREKRESMIKEKLQVISDDYYKKKHDFYVTDKDTITKFHQDRMEMFIEEFELNEKQICYVFKELLGINLYCSKMSSSGFEEIRVLMSKIKKVIELK